MTSASAPTRHASSLLRRTVLAILLHSPLAAQLPGGATGGERAPRVLEAARRDAPIRVDGQITEEEWGDVPVGSGFVQRTPDPGSPATEQTEVRVAYDDEALYVAARMHDSRPQSIAAPLARRDPSIPDSDWINVLVDSYDDRRTAFHFGVNPRGVARDIYHASDVSEDPGWDAVWEVATHIDSLGWTAEFRIPFSQLRFRPSDTQEWGVNFYRRLNRRDEYSHWAPFLPSDASFIPGFGRLRGLTGIRPPRRLELQPYLSARLSRDPESAGDPFATGTAARASGGLDVRAGLPLGLSLAATINPDFGQVEVDPAVINLTAFETLFPEQRPFFVEGAGIFDFGELPARTASSGSVVHTRRIGRTPQGLVRGDFVDRPEQSTILAAAKIGGQLADGWTVGLMDALTDRESARFSLSGGPMETVVVEPRTNYFVGRLRRDWSATGSYLGAIATTTDREEVGDLPTQLRSGAYLAGIDGARSWAGRRWTLGGYLIGSRVRGSAEAIAATQLSSARYFARPDAGHLHFDPTRIRLTGHDAALALTKEGGRWTGSVRYDETSPDFEPNDLGFRTRSDFRTVSAVLGTRRDTPGRWTRAATLTAASSRAWNFAGDAIHQETSLSASATLTTLWRLSGRGWYSPRVYQDRLTRGGPLAVRPEQWGASSGVETDPRRPLQVTLGASYSASVLGDLSRSAYGSLTYRPSAALQLSLAPHLDLQRNERQFVKSVADASATATFGRRYLFARLEQRTLGVESRVSWTFTPRLSLQLFMQPLLSRADYSDYGELAAARSSAVHVYGRDRGSLVELPSGLLQVDPDGAGSAPAFLVGDGFRQLDFSLESLRGNAVLRWEFRPGSALFLVWQQERAGEEETPGGTLAWGDLDGLLGRPARNVFLIKGTYWIGG